MTGRRCGVKLIVTVEEHTVTGGLGGAVAEILAEMHSPRAQLVRIDLRVLIAVSLLTPLMLWDREISRAEGLLLVSGLLGYLAYTVTLARRARATVLAEFGDAIPLPVRSVWLDVLMAAMGITLLVAGAEALVFGAVRVA